MGLTLSKKIRLFIEGYSGDVLSAMQNAGFEGHKNYLIQKGEDLLAQPHIQEAIREHSRYIASSQKVVADKIERQAFLTQVMRNELPHTMSVDPKSGVTKEPEDVPLATRLKALELLGKSEGDFVDRVDMNHTVSISELIQESYKVSTDDINTIEAQYMRLKEQKEQAEQEDSPALGDLI